MLQRKRKNDMALFAQLQSEGASFVVVDLGGVNENSQSSSAFMDVNPFLVRESIEWEDGKITIAPITAMQMSDDIHFDMDGLQPFAPSAVQTEWAE